MYRLVSTVSVCLLLLVSIAAAQDSRMDVTVSGVGFFTNGSTGNGLTQSQSGSGGLLASFRYEIGHHSALEFNYGFTRNSQTYTNGFFPIAEQQANVHEFTADYVFHLRHHHKLDPFVLAGGGSLVFSPITDSADSIPFADRQAKGTFLYGAGVNYAVLGNIGLRLQYRGLVYKTPDFGKGLFSTDSWTHTAEPTLGVTFRF